MTYNEIRNELGIYDDPTLNAACEYERKELLAERICNVIVNRHGYSRGLYNGNIFSFGKVKSILKDFGFKYDKSDDETECHYFSNKATGDEICIYPDIYYPNQGTMRFRNFLLS